MGCEKSLSSFLTNVLVPAGVSSEYTYNGYSTTFDGDEDNLAQFVGIPASPPGEFPAIGDPTADITFDPEGHTAGYYSFTYTIESEGGCAEQDVNFVIPIIEVFDPGTVKTVGYLLSDVTPIVLYDVWDTDAPPDAAISGLGWYNQMVVNGYATYSNGGTSTDITDDTFTPGLAGIGVYSFSYGGSTNAPNGYRHDCRECFKTAILTIIVTAS